WPSVWPAWTDAISSSSDWKMVPFIAWIRATDGSTNREVPGERRDATIPRARAPETAAVATRVTRDVSVAAATRTTAIVRFSRATTATAAGEPIAGIRKNGTTNVPTIAPAVLLARSRPA